MPGPGFSDKKACVQNHGQANHASSKHSPAAFPYLEDAGSKASNFADYLPHGIRIVDTDCTVRYVNPAFCELASTSPDKAIGSKCYDIFPSAVCHTPQCRLLRIAGGEKSVQAETDRVNRDSSITTFLVSAFPLYAPDNQLIGIMESYRDISTQKKLEGQVKEAEDRYKAMVELTGEVGEGILMLQDIDGTEGAIIFASPQCSRMTGYSNRELLGKSAFDLMVDKDRQSSLERHRRKMAGETLPGLYEITVIRKDGTQLPAELTSAVTQYSGKPTNVVYLRDITERKEAEKKIASESYRHRSLFDNAPVALWELDCSNLKSYIDQLKSQGVTNIENYFSENQERLSNTFRVINSYMNQAALELYEVETREEFKNHFDNVSKNEPNTIKTHIKYVTALATGLNKTMTETIINTVKGHYKNIILNTIVAPGYEKTLSRVIVSMIDITDLKNAQEELKSYQEHLKELVDKRTYQLAEASRKSKRLYKAEKQLHDELEKQMKQQKDFTRAIVHELKTPLAIMIGASEILMSNLSDGVYKRLAQNLYKNSKLMDIRIKELLDLYRYEIGTLRLNPKPENLELLLHEIVNDFFPTIKSQDLKLNVEIPSNLPAIMADAFRVRQIIQNLVDNSVNHSKKDVVITISAKLLNDYIQIDVEDNGPGILKEKQKHLFKMYYSDEVEEQNLSGLGMGLALCKILVELHGGRIWMLSTFGQGSIFSFTIPLA